MPTPIPAPTHIEDGPASTYMKLASAIAALIAAVSAVLDGDHSEITIFGLIASAGFLVTFAAGKYAQAIALIRAARGLDVGGPPR